MNNRFIFLLPALLCAKTVTFGQTVPLSGEFKNYGAFSRDGILAAFDRFNRLESLQYQFNISLVSLDDKYQPAKGLLQYTKL